MALRILQKTTNLVKGILLLLLFSRCTSNTVVDLNVGVPENNWLYSNSAKAVFEIKDPSVVYNLSFKIRNTNDYRYANLYVLMHLKGPSLSKNTRFQFQLANKNGQWTGKGSGDLFSNSFPLLRRFHFPAAGKYEIEIEQNMRDNPLLGISDIGLVLEKAE